MKKQKPRMAQRWNPKKDGRQATLPFLIWFRVFLVVRDTSVILTLILKMKKMKSSSSCQSSWAHQTWNLFRINARSIAQRSVIGSISSLLCSRRSLLIKDFIWTTRGRSLLAPISITKPCKFCWVSQTLSKMPCISANWCNSSNFNS